VIAAPPGAECARAKRGRPMTRLLISVRSAAEAEVALAGGADVIDVKEPRRGALGRADVDVWRAVWKLVGRRAIVSAALGELLDGTIFDVASDAAGFSFVKIGLAGCQTQRGWQERWFAATKALPA